MSLLSRVRSGSVGSSGHLVARLGLSCLIASSLLLNAPIPADSEPQSLGIPVRSMTIWDSLVVREEGRPILYAGTYTGTGNASVLRYDYESGSVVYYPLEDTKGAYGLAWDEGTLYVGTIDKAKLFRINAASGEITDLGNPAPDEQYIWRLDKSNDGRVFASTYPGCKLLEHDPSSGLLKDHGSMHSERQYAIALAATEAGPIYVGIGTPAALVVYDPKSGTKTDVPLGDYSKAAFAYPAYEDGLIYVRFAGSDSVLILDAETREILLTLDGESDATKYSYSRPSRDSDIVLTGFPEGLKKFDRETKSLVDSPLLFGALFDPISGVRFSISPVEIRAIDAATDRTLHAVDVSRDGEGMDICSMSFGPDGSLYGGVYNLLHLWRYDPAARSLVDLGTASPGHSGQYYDFCVVDHEMIIGSYTHAVLTTYDPANAWSPGSEPESNPRVLGPLGEDQYRPVALHAGTDGMVYIGSSPTYGQVGGALSVLNPATSEVTVHRHVIGDHSVSAVTSTNKGRILAGTALVSTNPSHVFDPAEAMLFEWDPLRSRVARQIAPVAGARVIHSLVTIGDDRVLGCADDTLFVLQLADWTVEATAKSGVGSLKRLRLAPDGSIMGVSSSSLVRIQCPDTGAIVTNAIGPGGGDFAISEGGDVYVGRGPELFLIEGLMSPTLALEKVKDRE